MRFLRSGWLVAAGLILAGCGTEAANNGDGDNNGTNPEEELAEACAAQPEPGDPCDGFDDCPETACQCADGTSVTTKCVNGMCEGRDACDATCAENGSENACVDDGNNNSANGMTNNGGNTSTGNNETTGPTCDEDLSMFAEWDWEYDVACLEQNCCDEAAYCATFASCRAYDDCLLTCFDGGALDNECVGQCREENATQDFLMDAYAPFSTCAIDNGC